MTLSKIKTYAFYFWEYLKYGDFVSIAASVKYLIFKQSHPNDRIIRSSIGKFHCRKNTNDFQFANYRYEWGVKKFLLERRKNFDVFIDGGSCIGEYCILLTRMGIRCVAFEPVEPNFDILKKNIALNGMSDKIPAFHCGLGESQRKAGFYFNPVNTGASHLAKPDERADFFTCIRPFDDFLPEMGLKPDDRIMFKLDVEGMEAEAIRGTKQFLKEFKHVTFVAEDKHIGETLIKKTLNELADFEFGIVDDFNMFAVKKSAKPNH